MKLSCDEAQTICTKNQYREATLWEKLKLMLHLAYCKNCSSFSKKNGKLTSMCQKAPLHVLSDQEKAQMKEGLNLES